MEWEERKDRKSTIYTAVTPRGDWQGVSMACVALLEKFCATVQEYYKAGQWDRYYVEMWGDSGRLITVPGKKGKPRSDWRVSYVLKSAFVKEQFENLPNPDTNPNEFDTANLVFLCRFEAAFGKAADTKSVKRQLKQLITANEFKILVQSADDESHQYELFL